MYLPRSPNLSASVALIPYGAPGIMATIDRMRAMVREGRKNVAIRVAAINLVSLAPPKDSIAEISAIFEFVRDSIRYVGDVLDIETLTSPEKTLELRAGDCDDKSVLLASLLESIGYQTKFVVAGYNSADMYEHVYVAVMLPTGEFLPLDATEDRGAGFEPENPLIYYVER